MKNKLILTIFGILLMSIFLISMVYAAEVSYCCEKTKIESDGSGGIWCQDAPEADCDTGNNCGTDEAGNPLPCRKVPTSCEATSYCKLGCCYDSQEGTCMENTPQKVCNENGGMWSGDSAECDIPQCSLGCCLIGEQAAFVTQTRCKKLSANYSLETNFRTDIQSEIECIASAISDIKGACVFEKEFEKTCLLLTKKECDEMKTSVSNVSFHENYLCSAEILGTNCGPTQETICVEGKDEVYFVDSCGNLANIYDFSKINKKEYWTKIIGKENSCDFEEGNANDPDCGNCDYYLGSTCKTYKRGQDTKPTRGNNICRNLSCEYDGEIYQHGETWCAESKGVSEIIFGSGRETNSETENLPGSRYFRLVCYNNEVTVEPCADFRQEVCIQSDIGGFKTAACRVNMWQDCVSQDNKQDCENTDKRDCKWINSKCAPRYSPGFNFWETGTDAESLCSLASTSCLVKYEEGFGEDKTCVEDSLSGEACQCVTHLGGGNYIPSEGWKNEMNKMCIALGDCGSKVNYIDIQGYESKNVIEKKEVIPE